MSARKAPAPMMKVMICSAVAVLVTNKLEVMPAAAVNTLSFRTEEVTRHGGRPAAVEMCEPAAGKLTLILHMLTNVASTLNCRTSIDHNNRA